MRIFLTGASGFLGGALARHWVDQGHELLLLARPLSRLKSLTDLSSSVRILRPDGPQALESAVREAMPDAIVHAACAYGRKGETPLDVLDANLRLGTALMQAVLRSSPQDGGPTVFLNAGTVLAPNVSLYALSKTQFSAWGAALAVQSPNRLRFIDIRLQQMYGPRDDYSKFTTHVIETCRSNAPRLALTAGEQRRDFIHIDDVVRAYDRILAQRDLFGASDVIEVGSGDAVTIREFVELARQLAGASTVLDFGVIPYRENEAMLCVADTTRLRELGWHPEVTLANGIRRLLDEPH